MWHWQLLRFAVTPVMLAGSLALLWAASAQIAARELLTLLTFDALAAVVAVVAVLFGARRAFVQSARLLVDVPVIVACIHFSGGVESKLAVLVLVPVILSAYELRQRGAWVTSGAVVALLLSYVLLAAAGRLEATEVVLRGGLIDNGAIVGLHVLMSMVLIVGFMGGEMTARIDRKARTILTRSDELAAAERETRAIIDNMGSGILTVDEEARVDRLNPAATRILGIQAETIVGRPVGESLGQTMPIFVGHVMECLLEGHVLDRMEIHVERSFGGALPLGLSVNPMLDADGERCGAVAVFQDLSSVVKMRDRMRSNDRLAAMGELSASIAHEIRNPLASIRGSVEMLQGELELDGENERLFALIRRESARLNRLVEDFLEYARLRPLQPRNTPVADLLDDLRDLLANRDDFSDAARLEMSALDVDLIVHVDEEMMRQVLLNLALNGFEAMGGEGLLTVSVVVLREPDPAEVVIRIRDEGAGVPADEVHKIFEPFYTTKKNGTGLGLPLANRIVTNHEGQLLVRNPDGGGAEFCVHLPLVGVMEQGKLVRGTRGLGQPAATAGS